MHTVSGAACLATKNDSDFVTNDGYPKIKHISFYPRRVHGRRVNGRRVCAAPAAPGVVRACSMESPLARENMALTMLICFVYSLIFISDSVNSSLGRLRARERGR